MYQIFFAYVDAFIRIYLLRVSIQTVKVYTLQFTGEKIHFNKKNRTIITALTFFFLFKHVALNEICDQHRSLMHLAIKTMFK